MHSTHSAGAMAKGLLQEMHFTGPESCLQHRYSCSVLCQQPRDGVRSHGWPAPLARVGHRVPGWDSSRGWDSMGGAGAVQETMEGDKVGWDRVG